MSKLANIAVIPKVYGKGLTLEASLANVNRTRFPGTGLTLFPLRENDGTFRTALDPNSSVYLRIEDKQVREAKQAEARENLAKLEKETRLQLDGTSPYYNFGFEKRGPDGTRMETVQPYKLIDGNNLFNLDLAKDAITFAWLSVHPRIASSLAAYNNGEYPSDTQFYVKDDEIEAILLFNKKKVYNDAIIKFNSFSPDKKRRIARLCDLPAFENTRDELVYNMMDDFLNSKELAMGAFKGQSGVNVFNLYANLDDNSLMIKDTIEEAFKNQIYRVKKNSGGKIFEGEQLLFDNKESLIEHYLNVKNQDDLLGLQKKLKAKKLASV